MATYKINGTVNDTSTVYLIQDGQCVGSEVVSPLSYEIVFESSSASAITAIAVNSQGAVVGFGDITPLDATGETQTLDKDAYGALTKTNQTTSYATGDDGDLEKGLARSIQRVTESGDAVVKDYNTGLMWVADPESAGCNNGTSLNWSSAISFANNLTFAGHSDWRCPNVTEMLSTMGWELYTTSWGGYYTPSEFWYLGGGNYFPDKKDFWTSTTHGENSSNAWKINVAGVGGGLISADYAKTLSSACIVRPVRDM